MLNYLPTCMTRALLRLAVPRNLLRLILSILLVHGMFCLTIVAQPEAAALCCVPWLFSAALVWAFAVGAKPLLLLLTAGMSALGISLQLSLGELPCRQKVLYLLGFAEIAVYFVVFTALIKALDLPTPGRRPEEPVRPEAALLDDAGVEKLIAALGGRENICTVDNCFTRLRVTVQDAAFGREIADAFALAISAEILFYIFAFVALCGALQTHFHGKGRNGKRHVAAVGLSPSRSDYKSAQHKKTFRSAQEAALFLL